MQICVFWNPSSIYSRMTLCTCIYIYIYTQYISKLWLVLYPQFCLVNFPMAIGLVIKWEDLGCAASSTPFKSSSSSTTTTTTTSTSSTFINIHHPSFTTCLLVFWFNSSLPRRAWVRMNWMPWKWSSITWTLRGISWWSLGLLRHKGVWSWIRGIGTQCGGFQSHGSTPRSHPSHGRPHLTSETYWNAWWLGDPAWLKKHQCEVGISESRTWTIFGDY